jgi:hypothetical protein
MNRLGKPKTGPAWMGWVNTSLARLESAIRSKVTVPVGGMVLWPNGAAVPEGYWLAADGSLLVADDWPLLEDRLGGLTLPNPTAVSGHGWIIRAG